MARVSSPRGTPRIRTSMRLSAELLKRLKAAAAKENRSATNLAEMILERELLRRERAEAKAAGGGDVLG